MNMSDILEQAGQVAQSAEELARRRDTLAYIEALHAGDFDTMSEIASRAECDPLLEDELWKADVEAAKDEVVPPEFIERATKMIKHIFRQYEERW